MRGTSFDADELLASGRIRSHRMVSYVEIRLAGEVQAIPTVLGGSVTVDTGSAIRRRATLELFPDDVLIPDAEDALLYPGRAHLHVWRGIDWQDSRPGTAYGAATVEPGWELWPLGVFLHTETSIVNRGDGPRLQVAGGDLSSRVKRAAWLAPYVIASGTSIADAWAALILDRWPDAEVRVEIGTDDTTSTQIVYGDKPKGDPWADARKLAGLLGAESYVDAEGVFVLAAVPDPESVPVSAVYEASTDPDEPSPLLGVERRLDADKGFSAVAYDSNRHGGTPLRGVAYDEDPASATYVDGDYGLVPLFASSSASSQTRIDAQAAARLGRNRAATDQLSIEIVPNPAHEERDVVQVRDDAVRVDGTYMLDGFTVPLGEGESMKASVRRVTS